MKRITLTFIGLILAGFSLQASDIRSVTTTNQGFDYRYSHPIQFETRGLKFYVFPDGTFEFSRAGRAFAYGQQRYPGRGYRNAGLHSRYSQFQHGQRLVRNRYGDIIRIGRTPVIYDHFGRVRRIGPIAMQYGRFGFLRRIGEMQVRYNPRGRLIYARGQVFHGYCGICGSNSCTMNHFSGHEHDGWEDRDWGRDEWFNRDNWDDYDRNDRRKRKRKRPEAFEYDDD